MSAGLRDALTRIVGVIICGFVFFALGTHDILSMLIGSTLLLLLAIYRRSQPITERARALPKFGSILLSIAIPGLIGFWLMNKFKLWP